MSSTVGESPEKVRAARILACMAFGSGLPTTALTYTTEDDQFIPDHERTGKERSRYEKKSTAKKRKRKSDAIEEGDAEVAPNQNKKKAPDDSTASEYGAEAAHFQPSIRTAQMVELPTTPGIVGLGISFEEAVKAQQAHRRAISFSEAVKAQKVHRSKLAKPPFQLLHEICKYPDILLYLTTQHLHPTDMLKLYSISKPYHYLVNSRYTTYMLCSARRWAWLLPDTIMRKEVEEKGLWGSVSAFKEEVNVIDVTSGRESAETPDNNQNNKGKERARAQTRQKATPFIFADPMQPSRPDEYNIWDITTLLPFNNYVHLCIEDPTRRTNTKEHVRHVPTFRYLFFLLHRARIATSIISAVKAKGHHLPMTLAPSLIKLGLLMDLPTTAKRAALLHNQRYFTDADLQLLSLFFFKLNMTFTDPLDGDTMGPRGTARICQCLLAQRSLGILEGVLTRRLGKNNLEMLKIWLKWEYQPLPENRGFSIMGIEPDDIGCLQWEGWRVPRLGEQDVKKLMPVEQGIMAEGQRRGLQLGKTHMMMMMYGH